LLQIAIHEEDRDSVQRYYHVIMTNIQIPGVTKEAVRQQYGHLFQHEVIDALTNSEQE
jgi:hypothetical protein